MGDKLIEIEAKHKAHIEESITFFDNLKKDYIKCPSCSFLIDNLIKMEEMQNNIDLSLPLALTPTDEFTRLAKTFDDVLEFKEHSIKNHFKEMEKIATKDVKDHIQRLKEAELLLHASFKEHHNKFTKL